MKGVTHALFSCFSFWLQLRREKDLLKETQSQSFDLIKVIRLSFYEHSVIYWHVSLLSYRICTLHPSILRTPNLEKRKYVLLWKYHLICWSTQLNPRGLCSISGGRQFYMYSLYPQVCLSLIVFSVYEKSYYQCAILFINIFVVYDVPSKFYQKLIWSLLMNPHKQCALMVYSSGSPKLKGHSGVKDLCFQLVIFTFWKDSHCSFLLFCTLICSSLFYGDVRTSVKLCMLPWGLVMFFIYY